MFCIRSGTYRIPIFSTRPGCLPEVISHNGHFRYSLAWRGCDCCDCGSIPPVRLVSIPRLICSITLLSCFYLGHFFSSKYCTDASAGSFILPIVPLFVHDTLIFFAISYQLAKSAAFESSWRGRLLSAVTGKGLFRVSRALMKSGQLYYL